MSQKILVVHGVGMNMRGKAQIETFGPMTLDQYDSSILGYAEELGVTFDIFHSNIEGEVINRLYEAHEEDLAGAMDRGRGTEDGGQKNSQHLGVQRTGYRKRRTEKQPTPRGTEDGVQKTEDRKTANT